MCEKFVHRHSTVEVYLRLAQQEMLDLYKYTGKEKYEEPNKQGKHPTWKRLMLNRGNGGMEKNNWVQDNKTVSMLGNLLRQQMSYIIFSLLTGEEKTELKAYISCCLWTVLNSLSIILFIVRLRK